MSYQARLSRYLGADTIIDEGLLRDRVTTYNGYPLSVSFKELPGNTRYVVRLGDRIEHLATAFYGNPRLWWVIAEFQPEPIMEPFVLKPNLELIIPPFDYVLSDILLRRT